MGSTTRMQLVSKARSALLVCLGYADVVNAGKNIEAIIEFALFADDHVSRPRSWLQTEGF
ncbi:hypothetical protein AB4Y87_24045 [Paenarthrobacter sp. RAF54_2]|uniref:hypothetical protein n=1 Tax=Paenarthrobacter sp. RAF54_2 TaxID=3233061 RepID=UPI003F97FB42